MLIWYPKQVEWLDMALGVNEISLGLECRKALEHGLRSEWDASRAWMFPNMDLPSMPCLQVCGCLIKCIEALELFPSINFQMCLRDFGLKQCPFGVDLDLKQSAYLTPCIASWTCQP